MGFTATLCVTLFACRPTGETLASARDAPELVVDRHIAAYNRHDVNAFLADYDDSSAVFVFGRGVVLRTRAAMRSTFAPMFQDFPNIHAETSKRLVVGPFVVDQREVTGIATIWPATLLSVYEVHDGHVTNHWQTVVERDDWRTAGIGPDPAAASTIAQSIAALNEHDAARAAAAYGDSVAERTLSSDTAAHAVTRDGIRAQFERMLQHGGRLHVSVKNQVVVGSYVASAEHITGLSDGGPVDQLVVAQVTGNHIVADWNGQREDPAGSNGDETRAIRLRQDDPEILHAFPP